MGKKVYVKLLAVPVCKTARAASTAGQQSKEFLLGV